MIQAAVAIVDIAIIIVLSYFIYRGYKAGFVAEFTQIFATLIGLILAFRYMSDLTIPIYGATSISPTFIMVLSFILIFTTVVLGLNYLLQKFLKAVKFSITLGNMDRLAGIAFGLVKGSIFIGLICALVSLISFSNPINREIQQSMLFKPMKNVLPLAYSTAKIIFRTTYKPLFREIEESLSGQPIERRGQAQDLIDFYRSR
ncbi:MAG: CvpA family protein [candidate division KSB1 bacterium]|nr:CvpA family protein [candidate division KSB1 bacterium]MDZ7335383.1 CvpA family protein [candidate division KSB1 bacterium]MDZ7357665.1 CvpA family protein [candidate division KSB1 bacterium]MDZ7377185.1 CvpA family protein [candidate division KSB1 bacterium]MDZ7401542.1 CvpA family protein [candidate division KSB1 bacterium]